ncbi:unnamed protein product [Rotaria sp. Silwood2]|nr:unnamed protein product [Rotaria sp. Silwood2]
MSYFEKQRKYTEIYSKTEYLRGYLEEKTHNQATDLYQFLKPSQRYAIQIEQFLNHFEFISLTLIRTY